MSVIPEWSLADRLRKVRQHAGEGQREFADQLGVASATYANWEAGNAKPRDLVAIAKRIELLTDVPAAWLLDVRPRQDSNLQPTDQWSAAWVLAA